MKESKVIRINEVTLNNILEYYNSLIDHYGLNCSLVPDSEDFGSLIMAAVRDAISYQKLMVHED